jgi:hypothetical protein
MNAASDPASSNNRPAALPPLDTDPWVRWTYTRQEWRAFNQDDEEQWRRSWRANVVAYSLVFVLILGFCAWISFARDWNEGIEVRLFFTIFTPVVVVGMALYLTRQNVHLGQLLATARWRGPRKVTIGPRGLREGYTFFPWQAGTRRLTHVRLDPGPPPVLFFRTTRPVNGTPVDYEIRVPVPAGHEADAQQVVERFVQLLSSHSL